MTNKARQQIANNYREAMKTYQEFNDDNKPKAIYQAPISAEEGDPCFLTVITYHSVNGKIEKQLEGIGSWPADADVSDEALLNLFTE